MLVFYWRFSGLNAIAVICPPEPFVPVRRRNSRGNHVVLGGLRFRLRKHAAICAPGDRPASRFARRITPPLSPPCGCLRASRGPLYPCSYGASASPILRNSGPDRSGHYGG